MIHTLAAEAGNMSLKAGECLVMDLELERRETLSIDDFWARHAEGTESFPSRSSVAELLRSRAWLGVIHAGGACLVGL